MANALTPLGFDTVKCRGCRVNSSITWALGLAGSVFTCKTPPCKTLIEKGVALVGHLAVNKDALYVIQVKMSAETKEEMEALMLDAADLDMEKQRSEASSEPVNLVRRNDKMFVLFCAGRAFAIFVF